MSKERFHILAIPGSLRRHSYNLGLVKAAQEIAPEGVEIAIYDIKDIPLFNQDVEEQGDPDAVHDFREAIARADALLIATPEYNYSMPGVLKNAIDWVSRPVMTTPLKHKPAAVIGAGGAMGTARAQLAWKPVFSYTDTYLLPRPELVVPNAREKFDAEGNLTDEAVRQRLRLLLDALIAWAHLVNPK